MRDETESNFSQFWTWIAAMKFQVIEKEESTGYFKIKDSPDYVVTDFMITTRRVNEKISTKYNSVAEKQWVTYDLDPWTDEYDPNIYNSTSFIIF